MKIRIVKPVGDRLIPYPSATLPKAPFFACIPPEGVRVDWPGPDGYWVRLRNNGVITAEDEASAVVSVSKKKEG
jgi:hypothetical protein